MNLNPIFSPLKAKFVLFSAALSFSTLLVGCGENASFITQCKLQGGSRALCECAWDKMSEKYSTQYLVAVGKGNVIPPDRFTQEMRNAFIQCHRSK
ncbi:hypothetical protein AB7V82_02755 [Providencia stuartii]|uniref:hypothetical protein n=1 Tax=Providencia TaxID=586 RepID=UPI0034D6F05E